MEPMHPLSPEMLQAARERRVSLRSAMGTLEESLAARAVGRIPEWRAGVETSIHQLRACMVRHVSATEGASGFHHEMVTAAPRLANAVSICCSEHGQIGRLVDDVRLAVAAHPVDEAVGVDKVRETGTRLLALLARHRQRGADMLYEAYQTDLGAGD